MHGFKTINEYTLKECADYLAQNEGGAYAEEVKARYAFLEEMTKREEADFEACKTADDFEKFIAKYKSVEAYLSRHLEDAEKAKQRLISEAKRLEEERRRRKRRTLIIVLATLAVAAVIVILSLPPQVPTFEELKLHKANEFSAKQQIVIGNRYYKGVDGYPLDIAEATFWYRMSVGQGKSSAQGKLNACREKGFGATPQDKVELKQIIAERMEKHGPNCNLNDIDVSNVTDMDSLFYESQFNGDISKWDVSNVTDMSWMFDVSQFNGDISEWDVSKVTDMHQMFAYSQFNGDISQWDVSNVTDMGSMFFDSRFNGDISKWDVSNVKKMKFMFSVSQFNGDISQWDVSNVTDMSSMFHNSRFNGDISEWDVSNVTKMGEMFYKSRFNGDISKWDVSNVTSMGGMFSYSRFNGDISKWDVSNVNYLNMLSMFHNSRLEGHEPYWYIQRVMK